jgi:hypothetical protein
MQANHKYDNNKLNNIIKPGIYRGATLSSSLFSKLTPSTGWTVLGL